MAEHEGAIPQGVFRSLLVVSFSTFCYAGDRSQDRELWSFDKGAAQVPRRIRHCFQPGNLFVDLWTRDWWGGKEQNYAERGRGSKQFVNGNFKRLKLLKLIFHRYFFDICVCEFDYEPTDEVILYNSSFWLRIRWFILSLLCHFCPASSSKLLFFPLGGTFLRQRTRASKTLWFRIILSWRPWSLKRGRMKAARRKTTATQLLSEAGGGGLRWGFCPRHGLFVIGNHSGTARC